MIKQIVDFTVTPSLSLATPVTAMDGRVSPQGSLTLELGVHIPRYVPCIPLPLSVLYTLT